LDGEIKRNLLPLGIDVRKEARRLSNRAAALRCRQRKEEKIERLETQVDDLKKECEQMRLEIAVLTRENELLKRLHGNLN